MKMVRKLNYVNSIKDSKFLSILYIDVLSDVTFWNIYYTRFFLFLCTNSIEKYNYTSISVWFYQTSKVIKI